jgi:cell division protein FtsN
MAETPKTAKANMLFGLIIGLIIAVIAAVVAFGFMSKNNSPVQTDEFLTEQGQDRDRLNRGFDPNDSLQSKVPIKSFNNKSAGLDTKNSDETSSTDNNDNSENNSNNTENASKIDQAKSKIAEVFDEFGDKKLAVKKETPSEEIDPDEIAMREAQEQKDAQKVAEEAKQKKLQQEKAKEAKIKEIERQERADRQEQKAKEAKETKELSDPIDEINQIIDNPSLSSNSSGNNAVVAKAKKVEPKEEAVKSSGTFYVQTGAFRSVAQADQQKAMLSMQGIQARVSEVDSNGQTLHRVRLGPFNSRQDVQKIEKSLEQSNLSYKVIKVSE